jgi:hypothetical protein
LTVEQANVVDYVHLDRDGRLVLIISDHLPWERVDEHLLVLQEKINSYLRFAESGEVYQACPGAKEAGPSPIVIAVVLKYPVPDQARWFFAKTEEALSAAGLRLELRSNSN